MLDVGCWMLNVECWMLDVGCWMFDVECSMFDVGCWMLDVRCSMFDVLQSNGVSAGSNSIIPESAMSISITS